MPDQKKFENTTLPEHPSDELVNRTLQMMNQRLEENRRQPAARPKPVRIGWVQIGSMAVAAAALAVFLLSQPAAKLNPVSFVYQPDMRLNAAIRTEAQGQSDLQQLADELDAALQPADDALKRTDYLFYDFAMNENSAPLWFASAAYEGKQSIQLTVANFATSLHNALEAGEAAQIGGVQVRTGVDTVTGDFFAVWQSAERYVQMRLSGSGLSDREKMESIQTILKLPMMKE